MSKHKRIFQLCHCWTGCSQGEEWYLWEVLQSLPMDVPVGMSALSEMKFVSWTSALLEEKGFSDSDSLVTTKEKVFFYSLAFNAYHTIKSDIHMAYWKTDSPCWASIKFIWKGPTTSTGDCGRSWSTTASVGASSMLHWLSWVVSLQLQSFLSVYCNLKRLKLDCFRAYFLKPIINRKEVLNFVVSWGTSIECQYTCW